MCGQDVDGVAVSDIGIDRGRYFVVLTDVDVAGAKGVLNLSTKGTDVLGFPVDDYLNRLVICYESNGAQDQRRSYSRLAADDQAAFHLLVHEKPHAYKGHCVRGHFLACVSTLRCL